MGLDNLLVLLKYIVALEAARIHSGSYQSVKPSS